ncbi:MAG: hypothetical protein JNL70_09080 [Saprospiraceae bacterium]|nr:hypothetical protein [Saprospiraceae bacterium]
MKNALIILALKLLIVALSFGQNPLAAPSIDDFGFLQGNWKGVLEYTDYQDDKTKVELTTFASFAIVDKKMNVYTTYIEPNGDAVYNTSEIFVTKKGDKVSFYKSLMTLIERGENRMVLTCNGEDNNQKSLIRETIEWSNKILIITKEVKYDGTETFLRRHQYRFEQESAEATQSRLVNQAIGVWSLDLRPSPTAQSYVKDFAITAVEKGQMSGVFYGTPFTNGQIHTAWGKLYFSFTTSDQSNTYFHSGCLEEGKMRGTSYSQSREFVMPWFSISKKNHSK